MTVPKPAKDVLNCEFPEMRARLIQLAAQLDRLDRAPGDAAGDTKMQSIYEALRILGDPQPARAEQIQLLFSRQYDPQWKKTLEVNS